MSVDLRVLDESDQERAASVSSYLAGFGDSSETRRTYESALRSVAALVDPSRDMWTVEWELLADAQLYDAVRSAVGDAVASSTASKYMAAVHGLVRHLARHGLADGDAFRVTVDGVKRFKFREGASLDAITTDELLAFLRVCRRDHREAKGVRDAAVLSLMACTGARRAEIAGVAYENVDLDGSTIEFVDTKGGSTRRTPIHQEVVGYVADWFELRGDQSGQAFCPVLKSGRIRLDRPFGGHAVWEMVTARREEAGVREIVTPHSFRRWYVSSLLANGVDIFTAARLVGHRSPLTTQRYDKRGDELMRVAVEKLTIPTREEAEQDPEPLEND